MSKFQPRSGLINIVALFLLVSCAQPREEKAGPLSQPVGEHDSSQNEQASQGPAQTLRSHFPQNESDGAQIYRAALWHQIANTSRWTDTVLSVVRSRISDFENARDKNEFCPNYANATRLQKEACWLRLISAVAEFESEFKPAEMFREPNGSWSVGLLALSPRECANASSVSGLKSPSKNLDCGSNMMADLIGRDGFIDGPSRSRGAASYWSTLRPPYTVGHYKVGKKFQVMAMTRHYREF